MNNFQKNINKIKKNCPFQKIYSESNKQFKLAKDA